MIFGNFGKMCASCELPKHVPFNITKIKLVRSSSIDSCHTFKPPPTCIGKPEFTSWMMEIGIFEFIYYFGQRGTSWHCLHRLAGC